MADTNFDDFLDKQYGKAGTDKITALLDARASKNEELIKAAAEHQASLAQNSKAIVNRLGLSGSPVGTAVNIAANFVSGGSKNIVGNTAQAPVMAYEYLNAASIKPHELAAIQRYSEGKATAEDMALIDPPQEDDATENTSPLKRFQRAVKAYQLASGIADTTDISSIADQTKKNRFSNQLEKGLDAPTDRFAQVALNKNYAPLPEDAAGIDNLKLFVNHQLPKIVSEVGNIAGVIGKTTIDNPVGAMEYTAENLPQWVVGMFGKVGKAVMSASNVGYGADAMREAIKAEAKRTGQFPGAERQTEMLFDSALAAGLEHAADLGTHGAAKTAKDIRLGFKQALKNTGKAARNGYTEEFLTESAQDVLETLAKGEGPNGAKALAAGAIGGISGGIMSGAARGAGELAQATPEHQQVKAEAKDKAIKDVVENNTTQYLDPESKQYSPVSAIGVLYGNSRLETATPEQKSDNLVQANKVVADLEEKKAKFEDELSKITAYQDILPTVQDPAHRKMVEDYLNAQTTIDSIKHYQSEISKVTEHLNKIQESGALERLTQLVKPQEAEVEALVSNVTPESSERVVSLAMAHPDSFKPEQINTLLSSSHVSDEQKVVLRSISEATKAQNILKGVQGVNTDVMQGDNATRQLGIANYQAKIGAASMAGNTKEVKRLTGLLDNFVSGHIQKAQAFRKAKANASFNGTRLVPTAEGQWVEASQVLPADHPINTMSNEEFDRTRPNGGVRIHAGSKTVVDAVTSEAKALHSLAKSISTVANYRLKNQSVNSVDQATTVAPTNPSTPVVNQSTVDTNVNSKEGSTAPTLSITESSTSGYRERTQRNANKADVTIAFAADYTTAGERLTSKSAGNKYVKYTGNVKSFIDSIVAKLKTSNGTVINVAGNGIYTWAKHGKDQDWVNQSMFKILKAVKHQYPTFQGIVTGGQTGTDIAGAVAAYALGLKVDVHMPKGFLQRGVDSKDFTQSKSNVEEYIVTAANKLTSTDTRKQETTNASTATQAPVQPKQVATKQATPVATEATVEVTPTNAEANTLIRNLADAVVADINDGASKEEVSSVLLKEESKDAKSGEVESTTTEVSTGQTEANSSESTETSGSQNEEPIQGQTDSQTSKTEGRVKEGQLTAMENPSSKDTPYTLQNLLATYLKQSLGNDKIAGGIRPLVAVKDFLSKVIRKEVKVSEFLPNEFGNQTITPKQARAFNKFFKLANSFWFEEIQSNLVQGDRNFWHKNLVQELVHLNEEGKLDMDENAKTAMVYAMFSYFQEMSERSVTNTDADINFLLGRDEDHVVTQQEADTFSHSMMNEEAVRQALGRKFTSALGLKGDGDTPADILPNLQMAAGTLMLKVLTDNNFFRVISLDKEAASMFENSVEFAQNIRYIQPHRNDEGIFKEAAANEVAKMMQESKGLLDALFQTAEELKMPTFEPVAFTQKLCKNSPQEVPAEQAKILNKVNAIPYDVRDAMFDVIEALGEDSMLEVLDKVDEAHEHVTRINRTKAKNAGLKRDYNTAMDFIRDRLLTPEGKLSHVPFFLQQVVWNIQRVGIKGAFNPQTNKLIRHLIHMPSWVQEYNTSNAGDMKQFRLNVLAGLGVKIDRDTNQNVLDTFGAVLNKPEIKHAINALLIHLNGNELTDDQRKAIVAGVKAGGEKMYSLDALTEYAKYVKAIKDNPKLESFTSALPAEVDGVSNGPMLANFALGASGSDEALMNRLNKGGFFEVGNTHSDFNTYRAEDGATDMYESTIKLANKIIEDMRKKSKGADIAFKSLEYFSGQFVVEDAVQKAGRNIIKNPSTKLVFGSSLRNIVDSLSEDFLDKVKDKIVDISKMTDTAEQKREITLFTKHVNSLLWQSNDTPSEKKVGKLKEGMTVEELLSWNNQKQFNHLVSKFKWNTGKAIKSALEQDFEGFIAQSRTVAPATSMAYMLYNAAYTEVREQVINKLIKEGKMPVDHKGDPTIRDLTPNEEKLIEKKLENLYPEVHTPFSLESSNGLKSGLAIVKSESKIQTSHLYTSEVQLGKPYKGDSKDAFLNTKKEPAKVAKTHGYKRVMAKPGVGILVNQMHSLDSNISHKAISNNLELDKIIETLNIHDAQVGSAKDTLTIAGSMNKATWDALLAYSPLRENFNMLSRTIIAAADMYKKGVLTDSTLSNFYSNLWDDIKEIQERVVKNGKTPPDLTPYGQFLDAIYGIEGAARHADEVKLLVMSRLAVVNQYSAENGGYQVTDSDREAAFEAYADLPTKLDSRLEEAIATISTALGNVEVSAIDEAKEKKVVQSKEDLPTVFQLPAVQVMQLVDHALNTSSSIPVLVPVLKNLRNVLQNGATNMVNALNIAFSKNEYMFDRATEFLNSQYNQLNKEEFGSIGEPTIKSDTSLVRAFERRGYLTGEQVLSTLTSRLSKITDPVERKFQEALLAALKNSITPNLKITYVTPSTHPDLVLEKGVDGSRGWYSIKGNLEEVYVLSPDFKYSGLTDELLTHELTHAALYSTMQNAMDAKANGKTYNKDVMELVDDLQGILDAAKKQFKGKPEASEFEAALSNVHEFVAWGLNNKDFRDRVIGQTQVAEETEGYKANKLINAIDKFWNTLTKLLFGKTQFKNGLTRFISNTSGLFYAAAQEQPNAFSSNTSLSMANQSHSQINDYTTQQVLEALPGNTGFTQHLSGLLSGIVNSIYGSVGTLGDIRMKAQQDAANVVWDNAKNDGAVSFATEALVAGFPSTEQEAFVMEQVYQVVLATLEGKDTGSIPTYKELAKLHKEAQHKLEGVISPAMYDFVFKMNTVNGKSDYLARFAALGLAHEGFANTLGFKTDAVAKTTSKSFMERLTNWFNRAIEAFTARLSHTQVGQRADDKLKALVENLVRIEQDQKESLFSQSLASVLDPLEKRTGALINEAKQLILKGAKSSFVTNSKNVYLKAAAGLAGTYAGNRGQAFLHATQKIFNDRNSQYQSMVSSALQEVIGDTDSNRFAHILLRYENMRQEEREHLITSTDQTVINSFVEQGTYLEDRHKEAITKVALRSDLSSLLGTYSMSDIQKMVEDSVFLASEMKKLESKLSHLPLNFQQYLITQAKDLAAYMAHGETGQFQLKNATLIARMVGTSFENSLKGKELENAEKTVDLLSSMYALSLTNLGERNTFAEVMRKEMDHSATENGVDFTLKLHQALQQEAKEKLFEGSELLFIKGYLPEITNPHVDVFVEDVSKASTLEEKGFKQYTTVSQDKHDPDSTKQALFVRKGGGMRRYNAKIISLTDNHAEGSRAATRQHNETGNWLVNQMNLSTMIGDKKADADALFNRPLSYQPVMKKAQRYAAPIFNPAGKVVNYHYIMKHDLKDDMNILQRNNRFNRLLGAYAGGIFDKVSTKEHNEKAIQALYDHFKKDYSKNAKDYVTIGSNSQHERMREIYAMLPEQTKQDIKRIWGTDHMVVHRDMLDIFFGYRERSITEAFEKDPVARNKLEQFWVRVATDFFNTIYRGNGKAQYRLRVIEDVWKDVVKDIKDIWVIKSFSATKNNFLSNASFLFLKGVPLANIAKDQFVAYQGITDYQNTRKALDEAQRKLELGYTGNSKAKLEAEIVRLTDELNRNPVKELIDAGFKTSIVEDVAPDDDLYSYKSKAVTYINDKTKWINPTVKQAVNVMMVGKDTKLYKALHHFAQVGDFTARYALYKHRISQGMSKEEAIQEIANTFVDYNLPSHRNIEFMNSMGLMWFTKYYMRVQKALLETYRGNPGRALAMLLTDHYVEGLPLVTESGFVHHLNNPFSIGALKYGAAADDPVTFKLAEGIFKMVH